MMNRRDRLMATLRGEVVDRPAVCFYELNGLDEDIARDDPFNIFTHSSWKPLVELTREKSDRIVMRGVGMKGAPSDPLADLAEVSVSFNEAGSEFTRQTIRAGKRTLFSLDRRDPDINTIWHIEHLVRSAEDLQAWIDLPAPKPGGEPDIEPVLQAEAALGDSGIVMIDIPDPLCEIAYLMDMAFYMEIAWSERSLFRKALDKAAASLYPRIEAIAQALPGRLWRIYGPEFASPPYLSPALFREYVVGYDRCIVETIQRFGGFARVHSHGNLKRILDDIVSMGCSGLDPIEPPPQGDIELAEVRERYGRDLVLFGNIELSELELLPPAQFERRVCQAVQDGTRGAGRGFVLMPSACPIGRVLSPKTLKNYETMISVAEAG
jgi:hypothetical protein